MSPTYVNSEPASLRIDARISPPHLYVHLDGELDMACAGRLETALVGSLADVRLVTVDLTDLSFVDIAGVDALMGFRAAHLAEGRWVRLTHPQPCVRRLFALLGEDAMLHTV